MDARHFFTDDEKELILNAIREAESNTSGEIRVHVSEHCPSGELAAAAYWFNRLKMHRTRERNGVLFYLAVKDRRFAIIGDAGINSRVPADFWDNISSLIHGKF
ncbi:MAG: TPM domain-containing protein, partial [Tannerella sp.]|nr:TPM domain-containing protein [Tannerella sp.]